MVTVREKAVAAPLRVAVEIPGCAPRAMLSPRSCTASESMATLFTQKPPAISTIVKPKFSRNTNRRSSVTWREDKGLISRPERQAILF